MAQSATQPFSITVIGPQPVITSPPLPATMAIGTAVSFQCTATGGVPPLVWTAPGLPTGVTINVATGLVSGTPTVGGLFNGGVTVTGAV